MLQTIEIEIDRQGRIHPLEPLPRLPAGRALLTLLAPFCEETASMAGATLAEDWPEPKKDEVWDREPANKLYEPENGTAILALLRTPRFAKRPSADLREVEQRILELRNGWDDE